MHNSRAYYEKGILKNWQSGMLTQSQSSQIEFYAKINHVKTFTNILKAISFSEAACIQIGVHGMKIIVEETRTVQAAAYFKETDAIFAEYRYKKTDSDTVTSFGINLKVIVENLNMFSDLVSEHTELKILYRGDGSPLILVIECELEHLTKECSIKTRELGSYLDLDIEDENTVAQILFHGLCFYNFLHDAYKAVPGADDIEFQVAKDSFTIVARGAVDTLAEYFLDKNSDVIMQFGCLKELKVRYRSSNLKLLLKTMQMSKEITLSFDKTGLLGVRMMVEDENQVQSYIEYFVFPLDDKEL
ncbi:uncharacterized protein LOC134831382 [Culicoides brevitarsis]|uniref:uncharacterized protein LOC134831382 n=1 Tax=Culicoides brevitarsis TaxID=469753 RepID=UPI00307BAE76